MFDQCTTNTLNPYLHIHSKIFYLPLSPSPFVFLGLSSSPFLVSLISSLSLSLTHPGSPYLSPLPHLTCLTPRYACVRARPSFAATVVDRARLVVNYSGYANGSASSDVARRFAPGPEAAAPAAATSVK